MTQVLFTSRSYIEKIIQEAMTLKLEHKQYDDFKDNMEYLQHDMNCLWTINFMFTVINAVVVLIKIVEKN